MSGDAGKGDTYRPVNKKIWDKNYEEALNDHREPEDFQKCKTTKIVYMKGRSDSNGLDINR